MNTRTPHPLLAAGLALAAAALACIGGLPAAPQNDAASFATVTPGGRISVSLLTPTHPVLDVAVLDATPIGPVATGTAAAATAAVQTQTAPTLTPTVAGLLAPPAECPAPGSPRLPAEPPSFSQFDEAIAQYLSAGGAPTIIEGRLAAWGALTDYGGLVRSDRDFTGDGVPEVLAVLMDPDNQDFPYPGDLYIFGCENGAYRLHYQAGNASNRSAPIILNTTTSDVNANGLNDLVYAVQRCTDTVCSTRVEVIEWNLTLSSFDSLLAEDVEEPFAQAEVVDVEADGLSEIRVRRGALASEAAGPQRGGTLTLRWDGARYTVIGDEPPQAEYRIHVLQDAAEALAEGDTSTAASLYRRAATETSLQSWTYPDEAAHLQAYARFRLIALYASQNNVEAAQAAYDELMAAYAPQPDAPPAEEGQPPPPTVEAPVNAALPGSGFAEMARLFWRSFSANQDAARACQMAEAYARTSPASYEVLNTFGYTNPTVTFNDLCPF